MKAVIVSNKEWHRKYVPEIVARTGADITYIDDKKLVTNEYLSELNPDMVFSALVIHYSSLGL